MILLNAASIRCCSATGSTAPSEAFSLYNGMATNVTSAKTMSKGSEVSECPAGSDVRARHVVPHAGSRDGGQAGAATDIEDPQTSPLQWPQQVVQSFRRTPPRGSMAVPFAQEEYPVQICQEKAKQPGVQPNRQLLILQVFALDARAPSRAVRCVAARNLKLPSATNDEPRMSVGLHVAGMRQPTDLWPELEVAAPLVCEGVVVE
eukprot:CAMPEP_0117483912 /NCGR_PEP_ID=MMETSP0784-20121206/14187_1 /TAXON_ID=39447 /ORGANISM="" /LENGTH=204 /DNA_ID=CAMNT_0005278469 /DNA_START=357 /DNA_END=968 /DNA_ORIENTATION=-